ncbi:MAG: tungsten ABC transporter substrate-binding protein, partial [Chloroflexi bacterium]|nr:tungsten ABC transporter substrate-binding protein [Chloroflexota bacterium]
MSRTAYRHPLVAAFAALVLLVLGVACGSGNDLILATTTSTHDSGLLDVLVPAFEEETGYNVK